MLADYMSKPVVGTRFREFRNKIMNAEHPDSRSVLDNKNNEKKNTNGKQTDMSCKRQTVDHPCRRQRSVEEEHYHDHGSPAVR